jgi:hypothetical protein
MVSPEVYCCGYCYTPAMNRQRVDEYESGFPDFLLTRIKRDVISSWKGHSELLLFGAA